MLALLKNVRMFLLASWLGAAIFFSAAVAPSAFSILRAASLPNAAELAGGIVNRTLSVVNTTGFVFSLVLLLTALVLRNRYSPSRFFIQSLLFGIMTLATAAGEWLIAARMRTLRAGLTQPMERLAATDSVRVAFDALHGYSVAALSIAIIAGLIAFFVIATPVKAD